MPTRISSPSSLHPDDRERVLADLAERNAGLTGSTTMFLDYRLIARDGRVVWIRDDEIVVLDEDGRPTAAQGYMQDVTSAPQDSQRLELLVGILSLAADETPPDEIVAARSPEPRSTVRRRRGQLCRAPRGGRLLDPLHDRQGQAGVLGPGRVDRPTTSSASSRGPIIIEDVTRKRGSTRSASGSSSAERRLVVDVPLLRNGELAGVLWFNSSRPRKWGDNEVSVLVDVAGQLAIVLANAEAREQRRVAERDLRNRDAILGRSAARPSAFSRSRTSTRRSSS